MITKEEIELVIKEVKSFRGLETKTNICRKELKKLCDSLKIDYSHFSVYSSYSYIGREFFNLFITDVFYKPIKEKRGKTRPYAICKCKCGNEYTGRLDAINTGKTKSCGCLSKHRESMLGNKNPSFKGIGEIPASFLKQYIYGAKKRNINWNLSIEDINNLYLKQDKKCALTGDDLYFGRIRYRCETNTSIDRIDSNKDYNVNNIQLVTKNINIMKQTMTQEEFINNCKKVTSFLKEK